ncbi:MAG TPA: hypothetical protein VH280_02665 [Verrucomicrobiae bacterium]|jgi:preprotein translocase subunit SecB|nr:hypothetical protein [Verrucomicrobiae bacterium]
MKQSPLQLDNYFVTQLHLAANASFDVGKNPEISDDQFVVESFPNRDEKSPEKWQVTLSIKHNPPPTANAPYSFTLEIIGFYNVANGFPAEKAERMVKTNGSSILYSISREIVRNFTMMGPYRGLLLPSASFFEPKSEGPAQPNPQPTTEAAKNEK